MKFAYQEHFVSGRFGRYANILAVAMVLSVKLCGFTVVGVVIGMVMYAVVSIIIFALIQA